MEQNLIEFAETFITDDDCKKYLSEIKWQEGFIGRKCGHSKYQERKNIHLTMAILILRDKIHLTEQI